MGESKTSSRRVLAARRQAQAMELRIRGMTYKEIAERVGYRGPSSAYKAVTTALRKTLEEPAAELRKLELERLDKALAAIADDVEAGDLAAVDRWIKLSESRRKLLGLDGPMAIDVTSGGKSIVADMKDLSDEELARIAKSAG